MKAHQILQAAIRVADRLNYRRTSNRLECVQSAPHYCESGYSTNHDAILFGNWNDPMPSEWDGNKRTHKPEHAAEAKFFAGVVKALETCAELEWEDEWTTCSECGGAIRTQADSYSWTRGFVELDGEILCSECAQKCAADVLQAFENEDNKCLTADLGISPADHGYVKLPQEFENGFHGGQDADPRKIAAALRTRGISRFVFTLDSAGQFDVSFSVWIHESEKDLMPEELTHKESAADLDPAEGLKRVLQSAPMPSAQGKGVHYVQCDASTGTATARSVSPTEFVQGIHSSEKFLRAYVQTALWSTNDESNESGGEPMDRNYSESDLAPETLAKMRADCAKFESENSERIAEAIPTGLVKCGPDFNEWERAAHDFWLTRNGHGAGFWDGDWPEPFAQQLTDAAHAFGEFNLYVGDDGRIYA